MRATRTAVNNITKTVSQTNLLAARSDDFREAIVSTVRSMIAALRRRLISI